MAPRRFLRSILAPLAGLFFSLTAQALPNDQCTITQGMGSDCPNPLYSTTTPYPDAARSDPGGTSNGMALGPIDVWSRCRYVDNISASSSIFVPFRSLPEWLAFTKSAPASIVTLRHCSRPMPDPYRPAVTARSPRPRLSPCCCLTRAIPIRRLIIRRSKRSR